LEGSLILKKKSTAFMIGEQIITEAISEWLITQSENINTQNIQLQATKKEFEGDLTFVIFPFIKELKSNPVQIGEDLGKFLLEKNLISSYNVVKGFLNFSLHTADWLKGFYDIPEILGAKSNSKEKIMVEYSSPNTNKPLHLGHLRNNFLGFAVSSILEANGNDVVKTNLVNDRGIHICKSMLAYQLHGNGETPTSANLKGDHLIGKYYVLFDKIYREELAKIQAEQGISKEEAEKISPLMLKAQEMLRKWEDGDKEVYALWKQLNDWVYEGFAKTYDSIGVSFDQYYYESNTYLLGKDVVNEGLTKGVFYQRPDSSVWVDLTSEGLDEKLVLRSDGTSVYITQDMGTAELKYEDYKISKSIYVVGNEQDYHFDVLKKILIKLEKPYAEGIYHLSYGMVDLPSGKMKSREGTVVDADDLIQSMIDTARERTNELGKIDDFSKEEAENLYKNLALGALKYYILRVDPKKRMMFNPEESIDFHGNTGPFIQYTYARIHSILNKAKELKIDYSPKVQSYELSEIEKNLLQLLSEVNVKLDEAANLYSPSVIANHVYEIAKEYNRFYAERPILSASNADEKTFRLQLCQKVATSIQFMMNLLGITVPERM